MLSTFKAILLAAAVTLALSACATPNSRVGYSDSPAPASRTRVAREYERCDVDGGRCVTLTCDQDGDNCWRESKYANTEYYRHDGRWVCDTDGNRCHYEYLPQR